MRLLAVRVPAMTLRPLQVSDLPSVLPQAATSFGRPIDDSLEASYRGRLEAGEVWGLEEDGTVLGHCRLLEGAHWLGAREVASLDIASVAVPPEHRGRGVASRMMRAAVQRGVAAGRGMSLLYPSTTRLYRQLGWELAGSLTRYRVRARALPRTGPTLRRSDTDADWEAIRACHARYATALPGVAVRSQQRWSELAALPHRYVLDDPAGTGALEGYALVEHRPIPDSWQHVLRVADWAATTPRGLAGVVGFAGSHGTFARDVELVDSSPPRWSALIAEQNLQAAGGLYWMARGLDLPAAIADRGFPECLELSTTLEVDDELAPGGPWRLDVADGRGALEPAPAGGRHVRLAASAVGPLLTGFRTASELAALGSAQASGEALGLLDAAFAGPPPVMLDFF